MTVPAEALPDSYPVTTFENDAGYEELVIVRDIAFAARCDCHGLVYGGLATVGYEPGDRIAGLSQLVGVVEHHAADGARPERLAHVVADALEGALRPAGLGVIVDVGATCGAAAADGARETTTVTRGRLRELSLARREFLVRARPRRRRT